MDRISALLFALAVVASPLVAHADDVEPPPDGAEDCILEEVCPKSGVLCPEDHCRSSEQCPNSGVYCDDEGEGQGCRNDAERAGLAERCSTPHETLYCNPGDKPIAGSPADCRTKAREAGLFETCIDVDYGALHCDPKEEPSGSGGGSASGGGSEDSGCAVRRRGKRSGIEVALLVFVGAAAVTSARAWRRRRSLPRSGRSR